MFLAHTYTDTIIRYRAHNYNAKMRIYSHCSHNFHFCRAVFFDTVFFLDETAETTYDKEKEF